MTPGAGATMDAVIGFGVDGFITNYPDVARDVMAARDMKLPKPMPPR